MESSEKLRFGWSVEERAEAWFLERHPQARLLARHFRCRLGEIDLVFEEFVRSSGSWELVFVEVRARLGGSWQRGVESVGTAKQLRLVRTIDVFLGRYRGRARSARLDILAWDGRAFEHRRNLWPVAGQR